MQIDDIGPQAPTVLRETAHNVGPCVTRYDPRSGFVTIHQASTGLCLGMSSTGGQRRYADARLMAASWELAAALEAALPQLPEGPAREAAVAALEKSGWDAEGAACPVSLQGSRTS